MMLRIAGLVCGTVLTVSLPALAATIEPKAGEVFIDRGGGYQQVTGPVEGNPGDSVMVMAGGAAEVVYADGCRQAVDVGAVVVIGPSSPCTAPNPTTGPDYTLVIGGVAVAGAVGAAIALSGGDDNDKPASP